MINANLYDADMRTTLVRLVPGAHLEGVTSYLSRANIHHVGEGEV